MVTAPVHRPRRHDDPGLAVAVLDEPREALRNFATSGVGVFKGELVTLLVLQDAVTVAILPASLGKQLLRFVLIERQRLHRRVTRGALRIVGALGNNPNPVPDITNHALAVKQHGHRLAHALVSKWRQILARARPALPRNEAVTAAHVGPLERVV